VLAIDIKGGEERPARVPHPAAQTGQPPARPHRVGLPSLPETMSRIALLSSANTGESARRHAEVTVGVRVEGVGLLEFHQIDAAREAGRRAAHALLESDPPAWLTAGAGDSSGRAGRRSVLRILA
jgi:predicted acylesterase/phospholipase RssA